MRILAIESAAKAASAAIMKDKVLEAYSYQNIGLTHSTTLMPMISDLMKNSGISMSDCDLIAVANGPGSFTGVRIGVALAKGLCVGSGLECIGISTLESTAYCLSMIPGLILSANDARRGEVYSALFLSDGQNITRLSPDTVGPASDATAKAKTVLGEISEQNAQNSDFLKKSIICIGDGAELCYNLLDDISLLAPPHLLRGGAAGTALAAFAALERGITPVQSEFLNVNYLRLSQAERQRLEKIAVQN